MNRAENPLFQRLGTSLVVLAIGILSTACATASESPIELAPGEIPSNRPDVRCFYRPYGDDTGLGFIVRLQTLKTLAYRGDIPNLPPNTSYSNPHFTMRPVRENEYTEGKPIEMNVKKFQSTTGCVVQDN